MRSGRGRQAHEGCAADAASDWRNRTSPRFAHRREAKHDALHRLGWKSCLEALRSGGINFDAIRLTVGDITCTCRLLRIDRGAATACGDAGGLSKPFGITRVGRWEWLLLEEVFSEQNHLLN